MAEEFTFAAKSEFVFLILSGVWREELWPSKEDGREYHPSHQDNVTEEYQN
jgi:hypothetical protein